jgi:hypothetical protein
MPFALAWTEPTPGPFIVGAGAIAGMLALALFSSDAIVDANNGFGSSSRFGTGGGTVLPVGRGGGALRRPRK